jgi:hypothetical protein
VAYIEYGTGTSYGLQTEQSESYYFNHLFHLKDLSPSTEYHYRIHAMGTDGQTLSSPDRVFSTKALDSAVIRIPEDMAGDAPYTLDNAGATYLLTQDLSVDNLAISIKANDVTLDLGGYTIVYDNAAPVVYGKYPNWNAYEYNERATFGIRSGLGNHKNAKVFNGAVKQGTNGGKASLEPASAPFT